MVFQGGHNDPLISVTTAGLTLPLPRKLEQTRSLLLVNLTLGRVAGAVTKCSRQSDDEDNSRKRWPFVWAEIGPSCIMQRLLLTIMFIRIRIFVIDISCYCCS